MKVPTRAIPRLSDGPRGSLPPSCTTSVSCGRIAVILKELEDDLLAEVGVVMLVPSGSCGGLVGARCHHALQPAGGWASEGMDGAVWEARKSHQILLPPPSTDSQTLRSSWVRRRTMEYSLFLFSPHHLVTSRTGLHRGDHSGGKQVVSFHQDLRWCNAHAVHHASRN